MAFARGARGAQVIDPLTARAFNFQVHRLTFSQQLIADAAKFVRYILIHAIAPHKKCDSLRAACDHGSGAIAKRMECHAGGGLCVLQSRTGRPVFIQIDYLPLSFGRNAASEPRTGKF